MRDLLSKLDAIISETALKDPADLEAKRQALDDLEADPVASTDSTISSAIKQRRLDLEKEAKTKGMAESGDSNTASLDAVFNEHDFFRLERIWPALEAGDKDEALRQINHYLNRGKNRAWWGDLQALDIEIDPDDVENSQVKWSKPVSKDLEQESADEDVYQIGDDFGISFSEDFEISTEIIDILEDGIVIELDDRAYDILTNEGFTFEELQIDEEKQKGVDGKACWKGYKRMGTKQKGGKTVDNCVKVGEDSEVDESGLQYYTGKKKYGKDGMAALAKAGRQGASEEELGRIKDKFKKEDTDVEEGKYPFAGAAVGHKEGPEGQLKGKDPKGYPKGKLVGSSESIDQDVEEAKYRGKEVPLGKKLPGDVKKSKVYVRKPNGNIVKVNFGDKKMRIKKSNPKRRKSFRARHNCKNPGPRWKARYWSCRSW